MIEPIGAILMGVLIVEFSALSTLVFSYVSGKIILVVLRTEGLI